MSGQRQVIRYSATTTSKIADKHDLKVLGKIPIDPKLSAVCDKGMIELFEGNWLDSVADLL